MNPSKFYAIWFSQRNGSTLLCKALESTILLGNPSELFTLEPGVSLLSKHKAKDYKSLQEKIYALGSSSNGVFGVKLNAPKITDDPLINELRLFPNALSNSNLKTNFEVWEEIFPNCKHIFLMRRNKVRQSVSWWKAIVTNEWHRKTGDQAQSCRNNLAEKYNFEAIKHLLIEITIRESKIQTFLSQGKSSALTIVYEDLITDLTGTVKHIGRYIGIEVDDTYIETSYYTKLADEISDEWCDRFRIEIQKDWERKIW